MKRAFFILLSNTYFFLLTPNTLFAQDSIKKVQDLNSNGEIYNDNKYAERGKLVSFTVAPVQGLFTEEFIGVEYQINPRLAVGLQGGYVHPNGLYMPSNILSDPGEWILPTVFHGYEVRTYVKYYTKKIPAAYWSAELMYRNVSAENVVYNTPDPEYPDAILDYVEYNAWVQGYGVNMYYGREVTF